MIVAASRGKTIWHNIVFVRLMTSNDRSKQDVRATKIHNHSNTSITAFIRRYEYPHHQPGNTEKKLGKQVKVLPVKFGIEAIFCAGSKQTDSIRIIAPSLFHPKWSTVLKLDLESAICPSNILAIIEMKNLQPQPEFLLLFDF